MQRPLNIAHRGGAGLWPENTLFALQEAARAGFDGAEIDVQLTADDRLAVFHDFRVKPALCRRSDGRWLSRRDGLPLIRDLNYAELAEFDVGRVNPRSSYAIAHRPRHAKDGERIPMLSDVIAAVRTVRQHFLLFIEIKTAYEDRTMSAPPETVAKAVIAELRRLRFTDDAVLVGFDWTALVCAKRLEPTLKCWFTTKPRPWRSRKSWAGGYDPARYGGSIPQAIRAAGGEGWLCSRRQLTPRSLNEAGRCGLKVGVWTVNDKRQMRALVKLGVDAIVTDRSDKLAEVE